MPQSCNSGSYPRRPSYSSTYTRSRPRSSVGELTTRCPLVSSASSQVINEVAIVTEVSKELGRLITPSNFANPNWEIFFSLSTHLNGAPLRELTEDLTLIFYPGCQVSQNISKYSCGITEYFT
ncbi:hypothetical protein AB6A40_009828 [Gnathostoma spinigerum]|uniref:Uncharacterized protein n=1 Tax=Gnathostoma spinigerum TaxID=75299 RepID=A0ABD6F0B4_9BILA